MDSISNVPQDKLINETELEDIIAKLATTSIKSMVKLNVGGTWYNTTITTLTREKNTLFTTLFSKQWQIERDPHDDSIFIDRNGKIFTYILEYLRTNVVPNNVMKDETLRHSLLIEAEYFHLHILIDMLKEAEQKYQQENELKRIYRAVMNFPNGTLLQPEHKIKLNEFFGDPNQKWQLIYKYTRDCYAPDRQLHTSICLKGPTMIIIQSQNNCLFGGYTSVSWTGVDGLYKKDTTAFLFTLTNPHNIPPTKYPINPASVEKAVYHCIGSWPIFGEGHDIYFASDSFSANSGYSKFPHTYIDTTGKGNTTFTGSVSFSLSDMEIYQLT